MHKSSNINTKWVNNTNLKCETTRLSNFSWIFMNCNFSLFENTNQNIISLFPRLIYSWPSPHNCLDTAYALNLFFLILFFFGTYNMCIHKFREEEEKNNIKMRKIFLIFFKHKHNIRLYTFSFWQLISFSYWDFHYQSDACVFNCKNVLCMGKKTENGKLCSGCQLDRRVCTRYRIQYFVLT